MIRNTLRTAALAAGIIGFTMSAHADIIGNGWLVPENASRGGSCAMDAVISCVPTGTANVSFTVSDDGLNFYGDGPTYNIGGFISSGGSLTSTPTYAYNATPDTPLDFLDQFTNYGDPGSGSCRAFFAQCGMIFEFTGTAFFTTGQSISVTSDDGFTLYVDGTADSNIVISSPGPQSADTNTGTYNGPTGTFDFTFVYTECCNAPAVFNTSLNQNLQVTVLDPPDPDPVPEPASIALFATVLAVVGLKLRRKATA